MQLESKTPEGDSPLVLIANDQEWTARAVESILVSNGYRVVRTYTAGETLEVVQSLLPDVVILDQQLPDFSGVEVCRRLRHNPRFGASLPIMITTAGPSGRQQRLNAYEAGAWDFFGQPLDAETLLHKLAVYYAASRESRALLEQALIDNSTGMYSRAGLVRRTTELLGEARRAGRVVSCVVWEMNGTLDGMAIDRIGELFRSQGRAADTFGRLELNRFAAVAPGTGSVGAERFAERISERLTELVGGDNSLIRARILVVDEHETLPSSGGELIDRLEHAIAA